MSTSNGIAAPASMVDLELVQCSKAKSDRHSFATAETRRLSRMYLGKEVFIDAATDRRVRWAQRGICVSCFLGILFFVVGIGFKFDALQGGAIGCSGIGFVCCFVLLYKNVSFVIIKRLFKEPNVIIIIGLSLCNWAIDTGRPMTSFSPVNGFIMMFMINFFVLMDAVLLKSRYLMIGVGFGFILLNVFNLYRRILGDSDHGRVLLKYSIQGEEYTIMKRSTQRSIILQVLLFSVKGIYTLCVDKTMKLMLFATGHIYKSTGKAQEKLDDRRNSYTAGPSRKSQVFFGKEVLIDAATDRRVRWAQRGICTFSFFGVLFFVVGISFKFDALLVGAIGCSGIGFVCFFVLIYKNVSFVILKRLFKEPNVIILVGLSLCNWAIDIGRPFNSFSPVNGFIYVFLVNFFVLMDAVMLKSRYLIIGVGLTFVVLNLYNFYGSTLGDEGIGVVLLKYSVQGEEYRIMKRSTKRSIYLQVLLFSANGIYTTFVDKSMKLMVFATGHIYKSTGTASEEIVDGSFAFKLKQEVIQEKGIEVMV